MENADDVVKDLVHWDVGVVPGVNDTWCDILQDSSSDLSSGFIENIAEVVLRQEGVSWIGAMRVSPWLVLVICTTVDNSGRALLQLLCGSGNDWLDEGSEEGEHEKESHAR